MPELPDIEVYVGCLAERIVGATLEGIRLENPFLLRSVEPRPEALAGKSVVGVRRLGKRVVIELEGEHFLVLHLMIAGRLHWLAPGKVAKRPLLLAAFQFSTGTLVLTEAGSKRRASLYVVRGEQVLALHDRGGVEPLEVDRAGFEHALTSENHTLKRALADPRLFSGIGNAYSDEILNRARLSPLKLTHSLASDEVDRLHAAVRDVLVEWTERLRAETGDGFPKKVTAFRAEMSVHGRFREACRQCGSPVQRIVYAENECNYCARCQTGGKLLADRALSRLLKQDWPKTIDELEDRRG
ncbi:MAG TPA: DNA-formamidopyrimidine glycosylase family protein [Planctomycetota bacterium]|nr:DNA-formamidopyrimidine glycosylase family protein [Planctomycetota bacterium]